jgi:hypothetical protein
MTSMNEAPELNPATPTPDPKQLSQAKLIQRLIGVCQQSPTMTSVEVIGALEVVKAQIVMSGLIRQPGPPPSNIIKPTAN